MKSFFAILAFLCVQWGQTQSIDSLNQDNIRASMLALPDRLAFDFLDSTLQDVEIVLLGEQGHGDGATFEVKTQMIKYLHEQMGFNVLAFESGLIDAYRTWEAIEAGADSLGVFDLGIFPVWTKSEQVIPVFEYILQQAKTDNPLILAGFDMQPTGSTLRPQDRFLEFEKYLQATLGENWQEGLELLPNYFENTRKLFSQRPSRAQMTRFDAEVNQLVQKVQDADPGIKGQLMVRAIENYSETIWLYLNADMRNPANTPHILNLRDKRMAENFSFLKEVQFQGEKIIGWGANTHFGYGRALLGSFEGQEAPEQSMIPMAQYLKIDYAHRLFSMAFTSSGGASASIRSGGYDLPEAKPGSLEHYLKGMSIEQAFIPLRTGVLANFPFPARMYGHREMMGKWGKMADGIYYIDKMEGSRFKK